MGRMNKEQEMEQYEEPEGSDDSSDDLSHEEEKKEEQSGGDEQEGGLVFNTHDTTSDFIDIEMVNQRRKQIEE